MPHPFSIRKKAELDIMSAYEWYESQRKGLGEDFLLCIEETFARITRHPNIYPKVFKTINRALIHRFPFGVFYFVKNDHVIVIAVLHARRSSEFLRALT